MAENDINIPGPLKNPGGSVTKTDNVFDDTLEKTQKEINTSVNTVLNGLKEASQKEVDTSISSTSSTNLPTTNAVKSYVGTKAPPYKSFSSANAVTNETLDIGINWSIPNTWGQAVIALVGWKTGKSAVVAINKSGTTTITVTKLSGNDLGNDVVFSVNSGGALQVTSTVGITLKMFYLS